MGNFNFLSNKDIFKGFTPACIEAEKSILVSPATCAILARRALELSVKWVYSFDQDLKVPYQDNLSSLIHDNSFIILVDAKMLRLLKYIVSLGNVAIHTNSNIKRQEAILTLHNLHQFISWIDYCYADEFTAGEFNEGILLQGEENRTKPEELKDLYEKLSSKDKKLEEIIKQNEELRKDLTEKRKMNTSSENYDFNVDEICEFETRKRYIDVELKLAGWDFGKDIGEEIEVTGMPSDTGLGYIDYVLYGSNGKPVGIVEAKRSSKDAKIGQQQVKLYADCIEKQFSQRPIIFYTNGFETYLWDDFNGYSERRVYGFFKKEELQLLIDRRTSKKTFDQIGMKDSIANRYYQKESVISVCEAIDKKQRKMLLVMATGSGKTRVAISIVDVLTRHNWVKNILFLTDRKALVKQAKNSFSKLSPDLALCNLLDNKDNPEEARMIFSTYPTMMNAIDDRKSKNGNRLLTPGHFDLIIVDESHRSIYKKFRAIFDYFDAYLLGLTATPKDDIDKNTYSIFDLESGVPTYAYELKKAVEDKYLVSYEVLEYESMLMKDGIKYDKLSDEDKEAYEDTFDDDENIGEEILNSAINEWLFNDNTIDLVLNKLIEEGIKIEGGEKLGKTIIFAKNNRHAKVIVERFNKRYPELGSQFCREIDYSINYVDSLIDDFSDKGKMPQIAVSVDMLDTGIDIPEILNLVFFKKVRSKSKFWQMIGRGTRLCPDLLGVGIDKEKFLVFDFCNNFEFFKVNPKGFDGATTQNLTERIFNLKLNIIKELQDIKYQEGEYKTFRDALVENAVLSINSLNEDNFRVHMELKFVHKYKQASEWTSLGTIGVNEIKENVSSLITPLNDDEFAKRFDVAMYTIQLAKLQDGNATKPIKIVIKTAEKLSKLGTIPEVNAQKSVIEKVMTEEFWESADIFDLDSVRESLRELLKYLEKEIQIIYTTHFEDIIVREDKSGAFYNANDLKNYRKKVEFYLKEHKDEISIFKLRNNKRLTKQDLTALEDLMWKQLGTQDDYKKEFGEMPVNKLVRKIVGLDRQAANEAFTEFLSNGNLNIKQMHFVKLIIDYVVVNGFIENNRVLIEDPFRNVGNITELFKENMDDARKIMSTLSNIKINSEEVG
ncbi:DEAD/DEAH box helicase family protein [Clostridium lacusfryxellense]|uniref:DEAD/DEAH box helicase family protein n=1 Tax=Clostridium lacusfryxellense TaxID=205328 RepID=UPI001C0B8E1B|nr:DEAD/DEAH box helicase family protein [Clostridium lacusfryxellense]MBU3114116.1 DEAD/DEAH box helicase family protein [Clostridium lacusfryxellense]